MRFFYSLVKNPGVCYQRLSDEETHYNVGAEHDIRVFGMKIAKKGLCLS